MAKSIYERVCGKQRTRKKKAAVALARKIAVLAWALMRDDKDWDPKRMIDVTESFGRMSPTLKATLSEMKPKENSDQRKSRLRREARAIREATAEEKAQAIISASQGQSDCEIGQATQDSSSQVEGTWQTNTNQTTASKKARIGCLMRLTSENECALLANLQKESLDNQLSRADHSDRRTNWTMD